MPEHNHLPSFEQAVLPHLDAAYNLARWLTRNERDAEDVVQESYLRAFRFFAGFRGGDARAWLMRIVRNTCYTWLHANRPLQEATEFDETLFSPDSRSPNPEETVIRNDRGGVSAKGAGNAPGEFSRSFDSAGTRRAFLQRDRRNYGNACGNRDVEFIACAGSASSSSYDERRRGVKSAANRGCEHMTAGTQHN